MESKSFMTKMINTYELYLNNSRGNSLTIEEAQSIYSKIVAGVEECRLEDKFDFWNDFLKKAAEYTYIRNKWEFMSREEKMEADQGRSLVHDSFITSLNILARIEDNEGIDKSWREELGDDRKRIGDFACFVSYITGISNR